MKHFPAGPNPTEEELDAKRLENAELTIDQRRQLVEILRVEIPSHTRAIAAMERLRREAKEGTESKGMMILGPSGSGKTTIIEQYMEACAPYDMGGTSIYPVLSVETPTPATIGGIVGEMLSGLGDGGGGKVDAMTRRLRRQLDESEVEQILLDEFQHFTRRRTDFLVLEVSDWLKSLMNSSTKRPIVLFGLPEAIRVLRVNEQLKSRFTSKIAIDYFGWGDEAEEQKGFRSYLYRLDQLLPFREKAGLSNQGMSFRLFKASFGRLRPLMRVIRAAAKIAIDEGLTKMDLDTLAEGYLLEIQSDADLGPNPLSCNWEDLGKISAPATESSEGSERNGKGKK